MARVTTGSPPANSSQPELVWKVTVADVAKAGMREQGTVAAKEAAVLAAVQPVAKVRAEAEVLRAEVDGGKEGEVAMVATAMAAVAWRCWCKQPQRA